MLTTGPAPASPAAAGTAAGGGSTVTVSHAAGGELGLGLQLARLIADATAADGHAPFGKHVLLTLDGQTQVQHALIAARRGCLLVGFLVLSETSTGTWYAELVADPSTRRRGIGTQLLHAARDQIAGHGGGRLRTWTHDGPAGQHLAGRLGMTLTRILLHQETDLTRPLAETPMTPTPVAPTPFKDASRLRTLRPGETDAWLRLSNEAFAGHPENGDWTRQDLDWRLAAPWTDLDRFIVAVDTHDQLTAGVWTKVEPGARTGELYVVAVHPTHAGHGLGRMVVTAALTCLREFGLTRADLYVDEANTAACELYASVGFTTQHTDRCFDLVIAPATPQAVSGAQTATSAVLHTHAPRQP